ncbi:MAG: acyl-CoA dehydrogenase family protein, partial [Neisseriaceae bacterium]|nr:acyl-CoA dehydrogenase family protein [Neisseriaceae bacterium]
MSYKAPIDDLKFALKVHANLDDLLSIPKFNKLDQYTVSAILEESARFTEGVWGESNRKGDINGAQFKNGTSENDESLKAAYDAFREAGWNSLRVPEEYGGQGIPTAISSACEEMWYAGNVALSLLPLLTNGAVAAINAHASQELKDKFLPKMCTSTWSGTMNLTEPQAGSDLAQVVTKAVPLDDGTYALTGQKIFITWGEHEFNENIIHLILARLPDAPEGTRGISLFIVPKFWVNDDGSLGERNKVELVSIEHKMGIHGSPTCV